MAEHTLWLGVDARRHHQSLREWCGRRPHVENYAVFPMAHEHFRAHRHRHGRMGRHARTYGRSAAALTSRPALVKCLQ